MPETRHVLDLPPSEVLSIFKDRVIDNASRGRSMDVPQYFSDLSILDAKGVLEKDPDLHHAIVQSGQNPLVWQGVYMEAQEYVKALQTPHHLSTFARKAALQGLQTCFRIAEITQMETPPNYPNPAVQQKVLQVWQDVWRSLNSWRPLLQEVTSPAQVAESLAAQDNSEVKHLFDQIGDLGRRSRQGEEVIQEELNDLFRQVSDALNLPSDISCEAQVRESQRRESLNSYPTASADKIIAFLRDKPVLFERIFHLHIPDEFQRIIKEYQPGTPEYDEAVRGLEQIIVSDAGIIDSEINEADQAEIVYRKAENDFWNLIAQELPIPIEESTQAFIEMSRTYGQTNRAINQILQKKADLFTRWAEAAGLKVVGFDDNGQIMLEEIQTTEPALVPPGTESVVAQPAAPAQPPAPEVRTSRLSMHVACAEFASFQEYFHTATKENERFEVRKDQEADPETDLVRIPGSPGFEAAELVHALEDYFHLPPRTDPGRSSMSYGDLYSVYGEKNGKFIFQGAGPIHRDDRGRENDSSLKLVFDSREPLEEFVQWMEESPAEALAAITKEIYPVVSERVYTPRRWIGKLIVANVNTGEVEAKTFERPLLDQDAINAIKSGIERYGSFDAVRAFYEKLGRDKSPRVQEDARDMLRRIDLYEQEFLNNPPS